MNKHELSKNNQPKTLADYRYNKKIDAKNKLRKGLQSIYDNADVELYTQRPIRSICSELQEQTEIKSENSKLRMPSCDFLAKKLDSDVKKSSYITQKAEEINGYIKQYHVDKIMAHHVFFDKEYSFEGKIIHLNDIKKAVDNGSLDPNRLVDESGLNLLAKLALALEYRDKKLRIEILKFIGDLIDKGGSLFSMAEGQQLIPLAVLKQIQMNIRDCVKQEIMVPEPLSIFSSEDLDCRILYKNLKENTESLKISAQPVVVCYVENSSAHINTMSLVLTEVIAKFDDDYKRDRKHSSWLKKNSAHQFYEKLKEEIEKIDIDTVAIEKTKSASKVIQYLQYRIGNTLEDKDSEVLENINAQLKKLGEDVNIIDLLVAFEPAVKTGKDILELLRLFCEHVDDRNKIDWNDFISNTEMNSVTAANKKIEFSKIERAQLWSVLTTADKIMAIGSNTEMPEMPEMATKTVDALKQHYHSLIFCKLQSHGIVSASFNQFVTKIINITNSEEKNYLRKDILSQMPCLIASMTGLLKAGQFDVAKNLLIKIAKISCYDDIVNFAPGVYSKFIQVRDGDYSVLNDFIKPAGGHNMTGSPIGVSPRGSGAGGVSDVKEDDGIENEVQLSMQ